MITLKPGSVRTISEAPLAASVASATAIPMSAFFSAGASFTPSPVIPQICFLSCNFLTISYLCSKHSRMEISDYMIGNRSNLLLADIVRFGSLCSQPHDFKTRLLGRGFHTLIRNVPFPSPTDVGFHNPPPWEPASSLAHCSVSGFDTIWPTAR